jgi:hypothetical protein
MDHAAVAHDGVIRAGCLKTSQMRDQEPSYCALTHLSEAAVKTGPRAQARPSPALIRGDDASRGKRLTLWRDVCAKEEEGSRLGIPNRPGKFNPSC